MQKKFYFILLICLPVLVYIKLVKGVGFLSDDLGIIEYASTTPLWKPLEPHHYSLAINLIFKAAAKGILSFPAIHVLTLITHIANTLLIFSITQFSLKWEPWQAFLAALLFSINPTGLEALTWCCALGYILSSFWILLAIYVYLKYFNLPWLIFFQLMAILTWDWGILLTPILLVVNYFQIERKRLYPLALFWMTVFILKKLFLPLMGYQLNSVKEIATIFFSSPFVALFPNFSKAFYKEPTGIIAAVLLLIFIAWSCYHSSKSRMLAAILCLCLIPQALFSFPQSRYYYLFMFPLYTLLLIPFKRTYLSAFACLLLILNFAWTSERLSLWIEASQKAEQLRQELSIIADSTQQPLVVLNLPDRYGPEQMIWLPYMWRFSKHMLSKDFIRMNTPDCPNLHQHQEVPVLDREAIAASHQNDLIYEIIYHNNGDFFYDFSLKKVSTK